MPGENGACAADGESRDLVVPREWLDALNVQESNICPCCKRVEPDCSCEDDLAASACPLCGFVACICEDSHDDEPWKDRAQRENGGLSSQNW